MSGDDALKRAMDALLDPAVKARARQAVAAQIEKLEANPVARGRAREAFQRAVVALEREEEQTDVCVCAGETAGQR